MAAKTTWVALLPKFSSFVGPYTFRTDPISVVGYDRVELVAWRGAVAASGTFNLKLEESIDGQIWSSIFTGDPGIDTEAEVPASLTAPWLRVAVELSGTVNVAVTCWLVGMLIKRR